MLSSYELDQDRIRQELPSAEIRPTDEPDPAGTGCALPRARALVADNIQPTRMAAADILRTQCNVEVIAIVADGVQAIDEVFRLKPDVLVMEIVLPKLDGIRVIRVVRKSKTQTKIVVLTGLVDGSFQRAALDAGAQAYVLKGRMLTDLPLAIKAVLDGKTFCSPQEI